MPKHSKKTARKGSHQGKGKRAAMTKRYGQRRAASMSLKRTTRRKR